MTTSSCRSLLSFLLHRVAFKIQPRSITRVRRYQLQSTYLHLPVSRIQALLEKKKAALDERIGELEKEQEEGKMEMARLKVELCSRRSSLQRVSLVERRQNNEETEWADGKFGKQINLDR